MYKDQRNFKIIGKKFHEIIRENLLITVELCIDKNLFRIFDEQREAILESNIKFEEGENWAMYLYIY